MLKCLLLCLKRPIRRRELLFALRVSLGMFVVVPVGLGIWFLLQTWQMETSASAFLREAIALLEAGELPRVAQPGELSLFPGGIAPESLAALTRLKGSDVLNGCECYIYEHITPNIAYYTMRCKNGTSYACGLERTGESPWVIRFFGEEKDEGGDSAAPSVPR